MLPASPTRLRRHHVRLLLVLAATALCANLAPHSPSEAATLLVSNGSFETSLTGWRTNSHTTMARTTSAHEGSGAVVLTAKAGKTAILDDEPNSVSSSAKGTRYAVTAWVRTDKPNLSGQLRVRQVSTSGTTVSGTSFWLTSTAWSKVTLSFATKVDKSSLDVSVLGWKVASGQKLYVDAVSMATVTTTVPSTGTGSTPSTADSTAVSRYALSDGAGVTARGIPLKGALFGATYNNSEEPTAFEAQLGARLGVHRTFWKASQVDLAVASARADLAAGRLPWISFKLPYGWPNMSLGKGDSWATDISEKLAKLPGPVWVAFHHEPEGDGDIADWVKIQERLSPIVHAKAPNVAYTVIYTGWYQFYGPEEKYKMNNVWPNTKIDVVGFDVYQQYGITKNGKVNRNVSPMKTAYFEKFDAFAKSKGTRWAIGETAQNDVASAELPKLMKQTYDDMVATHGIAMSYFNTHYHSDTTWAITNQEKTAQFAAVLRSTAHLPKLV